MVPAAICFADVLQKNDQAVIEMVEENMVRSNQHFRECFLQIKKCLAKEQLLPGSPGEIDSRWQNTTERSSVLSSTTAASHAGSLEQHNSSKQNVCLTALDAEGGTAVAAAAGLDGFYIYNRPILLGRHEDHQTSRLFLMELTTPHGKLSLERCTRLLSATIMFNLALLYHVRSRHQHQEDSDTIQRRSLLARAQKLYSTVIELILSSGNDDEGNDEDCYLLGASEGRSHQSSSAAAQFTSELHLVALNNYMQLSMELGNFDQASQAVLWLYQFSCHTQSFSTRMLLEEWVWEEIQTNMVVVWHASFSLPPWNRNAAAA